MRSFDSIDAFLRHLSRAPARMAEAEHAGLEAVGERLVAGAQAMIGVEVREWAPLAEATIMDKASKGYGVPNPLLRTGELRTSITYSVQGHAVLIGTDDPIATYQEFGTSRIPPRPFISSTMFRDGHAAANLVVSYLLAGFCGTAHPRPPPGPLTGR